MKVIPSYNEKYGWIEEVINCVENRTKYTKNEIRVYENGICEIDVYDIYGKYKDTGLFSKEDIDLVKQHKWYKDSLGYLSTTINKKKVRLHRFLFPNELSDHIDNNRLNNTRDNLQQISHAMNIAKSDRKIHNPNGVIGIFLTPSNTWQASIEINSQKQTKNFSTKEDAILMRYIWELNFWGKNAPQYKDIKEKYPRLINGIEMNCKISENIKLVNTILQKLSVDGHCPCRLKKTPETKCMCKEFRDMIENGENGMCHCGLYILKQDD